MVGSRLMQRLARLSTAQNQPRKVFKDTMATLCMEYERAIDTASMAIMGNEVDDSTERYDVECMKAELAVATSICEAWKKNDADGMQQVARMTCHFLIDAEFAAEVLEIAQRLRGDTAPISVMLYRKSIALMSRETMQDEQHCEITYRGKCVEQHGVLGNAGAVLDAIAARANGQEPNPIFKRAAEIKHSQSLLRALHVVFP